MYLHCCVVVCLCEDVFSACICVFIWHVIIAYTSHVGWHRGAVSVPPAKGCVYVHMCVGVWSSGQLRTGMPAHTTYQNCHEIIHSCK